MSGTFRHVGFFRARAGINGTHLEVCMINYTSGLVFVVLMLIGAPVGLLIELASPLWATVFASIWLVGAIVTSSSIKLAAQWEHAVVFRLGQYHDIRGPGLFLIIPLIDQVRLVDKRIRATDIPAQQVITKDHVPETINEAFFVKVDNVSGGRVPWP